MTHDPDKRINLDEYELGSQERHIARRRNEALKDKKFVESLIESIPTRPVLDLDVPDLIKSEARLTGEINHYDQELARRDAAKHD